MDEAVIDDIISLESSLNEDFLALNESGLQLANTVNTNLRSIQGRSCSCRLTSTLLLTFFSPLHHSCG